MSQLWWRPSLEGVEGVEGNEAKAPLLGKLDARAPSPIWMDCQDEDLYFIDDAIEGDGDGAVVSHQSKGQKEGCREKRKKRKRKGTLYPQNLRYNHGKHKVLKYSM